MGEDQRPCDYDTLALAAGKFVGKPVCKCGRQADLAQRTLDGLPDLPFRPSPAKARQVPCRSGGADAARCRGPETPSGHISDHRGFLDFADGATGKRDFARPAFSPCLTLEYQERPSRLALDEAQFARIRKKLLSNREASSLSDPPLRPGSWRPHTWPCTSGINRTCRPSISVFDRCQVPRTGQ